MEPEEQKAPDETKIPVQFGASPEPEEPVETPAPENEEPAPEPAPPEEPEEPAEHPVPEVPSLSEQPPEEPEPQVPEPTPTVEPEAPAEPAPSVPSETPVPNQQFEPQPVGRSKSKSLMMAGLALAIFVLLIVAVTLLGGGHKKPKTASAPPVAAPTLYTDQTGFKIMRPAGWDTVTPAAGSGDLAEFKNPAADAVGTNASYHPLITISSAPTQAATLAQIVSSISAALAKQAAGYKSLATTPETVNGLTATLLTYSYTLPASNGTSSVNVPLTADELIVIKGSTGYVLRGVALTANWQQRQGDIEKSLLSFQP